MDKPKQKKAKKPKSDKIISNYQFRIKDSNKKLVYKLVNNNHTIVNSDINIKSLIRSKLKGHAKAWTDIGIGELRSALKSKAKKHNVTYVEVSERILVSAQTCSHCKALTGPRGRNGLSISAWACPKCGK